MREGEWLVFLATGAREHDGTRTKVLEGFFFALPQLAGLARSSLASLAFFSLFQGRWRFNKASALVALRLRIEKRPGRLQRAPRRFDIVASLSADAARSRDSRGSLTFFSTSTSCFSSRFSLSTHTPKHHSPRSSRSSPATSREEKSTAPSTSTGAPLSRASSAPPRPSSGSATSCCRRRRCARRS